MSLDERVPLHVFNTQAFRQAFTKAASGVEWCSHTSPKKILSEVVVSLPDFRCRTAAHRLHSSTSLDEETQRLASIYQQKLAALEALKKSLLHQAFTGQL